MSLQSLGKKLARLHESAQQRALLDCPGCHDRKGRTVLVTALRHADGREGLEKPHPATWFVGGEVPERIITVIRTVVDAYGEVIDP